jgi:hemerythrin
VTTMNIPTAPPTSSRPQDVQAEGLRHDLVDAQVQVLSIYLDKRPPEHLVTALDRLIKCCRASFREEEALMARLGGQIDPAHRERHQTVMHQLSELRLGALVTDRGRLLASLILIDRELIAHIAEAALVSAEA